MKEMIMISQRNSSEIVIAGRRGEACDEPAELREMLGLRLPERNADPLREGEEPRRLRVQPGIPLLLGQGGYIHISCRQPGSALNLKTKFSSYFHDSELKFSIY